MEKEIKFLLYSTPQENVKIDVVIKDETIWLTQKAMAVLFDTSRENITMHLKNVFESDELQEVSVCKKFLLTAADSKNYNTQVYNLDAIISVGYQIISHLIINTLNQSYIREMFISIANDVTKPNICNEQINSIPLVILNERLISQYNNLLQSFYTQILRNQQESSTLVQLRDFLLPFFMNGQVKVNIKK